MLAPVTLEATPPRAKILPPRLDVLYLCAMHFAFFLPGHAQQLTQGEVTQAVMLNSIDAILIKKCLKRIIQFGGFLSIVIKTDDT